jgi:hypothetical protein
MWPKRLCHMSALVDTLTDAPLTAGSLQAILSIHAIHLVTLQDDFAITVIHMSSVLTFPTAALLAGYLRGRHKIYAQSWNVEDGCQENRASWGTSEQQIAFAVYSTLLATLPISQTARSESGKLQEVKTAN